MAQRATIQLIAPSGWPQPGPARRGVARLREKGCEVIGESALMRRHLRFAGTDRVRVEEINNLADTSHVLPDIVMAVRGGYGMHRLLPRLNYKALSAHLHTAPCALVGYSDVTALSLALLAQSNLVTFAGPMLAHDFGAQQPDAFTLDAFWRTMSQPSCQYTWQANMSAPVDGQGVLWGGNLALVCSLLGTPYFPHIEQGIVFFEDIGEPWFRVERMLSQLALAGVLDRQQAILLGDFSSSTSDVYSKDYHFEAVINALARLTSTPIITGLPFGHGHRKITLPIGGQCRVVAKTQEQVVLTLSDYPCPLSHWAC